MGRNKGYYNKDTERARQEKEQMRKKYKSSTAIRLKEKVTGETNLDTNLDAAIDFVNIYQNDYDACYSGFAKRTIEKNFYNTYQELIDIFFSLGIAAPGLAK